METILLVLHVLVALALIGLVLLQQGKGADAGAAFGSGASATVFGARGSASFLTRTTAILASIFFVTSLSLAYFSGQTVSRKSVTEIIQGQESSQAVQPGSDVPSPETQPAKPDVPQPVR